LASLIASDREITVGRRPVLLIWVTVAADDFAFATGAWMMKRKRGSSGFDIVTQEAFPSCKLGTDSIASASEHSPRG
jgi:hypothetical protein